MFSNPTSPSIRLPAALLAGLLLFALSPGFAANADARPKKCFGKKINKVVSGGKKKVKLGFKDVAWVSARNVTVIGKPHSRICAGAGRQIIYTGKGTSMTDAGPGDDKIVMAEKSVKSKVYGGLGNDEIIGSRGHDLLYGGPKSKKVPAGAADDDVIDGLGGNDKIYDYAGQNRLYGREGSDSVYSLGSAVSELHGGNGSDFLYSNGGKTADGVIEKLFGEQGNDRLRADQPGNYGPAYLDGGEGDDWVYGTPQGDTIIYNSGIKEVWGMDGDDLFVTSSRGQGKFDGGAGRDTISFAAHTPAEREGFITGVKVDLDQGTSLGYSRYQLNGIEDVIGSAFDDRITGVPGVPNRIEAGIGNDEIVGQSEDEVDGGLGENECSGGKMTNCNEDSPGNQQGETTQVDITEGGLPIIMGSDRADDITVGYQDGAFQVDVANGALPSGLCERTANQVRIVCPVDRNNLNGMLVYGDAGDDAIRLDGSVPATLTTTINGGTGVNTITGGPSKDFISTAPGSAGSFLDGGEGLDILYAYDGVSLAGGPDTDIFRVVDPCLGASMRGDSGTDSVVFAGAPRGVKADLAGGYAEWREGGCPAGSRTTIANDIEKLEGTDSDDHLIVGLRNAAQDGKSVLFGRGGIDILDAKNGSVDTITTGSGGRSNTVIADKKDNVIWGFGLAGR